MQYHSPFTYFAFYFGFLRITPHDGHQAVNVGDDIFCTTTKPEYPSLL